jgi:hypothetical protein
VEAAFQRMQAGMHQPSGYIGHDRMHTSEAASVTSSTFSGPVKGLG